MRRLRISMMVAGLVLVSAACSGGSAEPAAGGSAAEATIAPADSGAPADSAAPVETAAPVVSADGDAACLQGTWQQGPARLQAFIDQIGSPLAMTVQPDSLMTLTLAGDTVDVSSTVTLQVVSSDLTMQMTGTGRYSGTFDAADGSLTVSLTSQEYTAGDWVMTLDGQTVAVPGMAPVDPGPPLSGLGTYTCTDTTLSVITGGRTSIFDRA